MRAEADDAVGAAAAGLGDDVAGLVRDGLGGHVHGDLDLSLGEVGGQLLALGLGDADGRDVRVLRDLQVALHGLVAGVVVQDEADGARLGRGGLLLGEGAGAALHQGDLAGEGVGRVVVGLAARGVVDAGGGERGLDAALGRGLAEVERQGGQLARVGREHGGALAQRLRLVEREVLVRDLVTGLLQAVVHVLRGRLVALGARGAVAAVGVGYLLELLQVTVGALARGLLHQLLGELLRLRGLRRVTLGGAGGVLGTRRGGGEQEGGGDGRGDESGRGPAAGCAHGGPSLRGRRCAPVTSVVGHAVGTGRVRDRRAAVINGERWKDVSPAKPQFRGFAGFATAPSRSCHRNSVLRVSSSRNVPFSTSPFSTSPFSTPLRAPRAAPSRSTRGPWRSPSPSSRGRACPPPR